MQHRCPGPCVLQLGQLRGPRGSRDGGGSCPSPGVQGPWQPRERALTRSRGARLTPAEGTGLKCRRVHCGAAASTTIAGTGAG